ncbi:hypothetical protein [Microbacterium lacticum]|uniref:hypothetical protein n=1 Tax=Microbacterium lacticum TaxID=33885 RepID=UPI0028D8AB81|nr:hypothetical protein [Microbacterium lacticum]
MTSTDLAPIGLQAAPDGTLPCAVCGTPTTGPTTTYPVLSRILPMGDGERVEEVAPGSGVDLPTCSDCQGIAETARQIVAAHRGLVRLLGTVATWQTTTALYALDTIGQPIPGPDIEPHRLGSLVHRLAAPGTGTMYSRRFSPVMLAGSSTKLAARERWSAVDPSALADCRGGYLDWKADGRPIRALAHPGRRRCEWCGTATFPGRRVSEVWFGDLCAKCHAVHEAGGTSYEAMWEAIDPDRAIRRRRADVPDIDGVHSYSRAGGGNGEPWSHLGGIPALHEHVARLVDTA